MKAKNYPNLHAYPSSRYWQFRKYSNEKKAEFVVSTKVEASEKNAGAAYKVGLEKFNTWLRLDLPVGKPQLVGDLLRALLVDKRGAKKNTFKSFRVQAEVHAIPAFGNFRPDQVTGKLWDAYDEAERAKGRTRTSHTRQVLLEALGQSVRLGLLKALPELTDHDPPPAPPTHLPSRVVRAILHLAAPTTLLLAYIMWKQGARPGEILQYRWDMIDFNEGAHGVIRIPAGITKTDRAREIPLNSRVSRVLRYIKTRGNSWQLDKASLRGLSGRERRTRRFIVASAHSPFLFPSKGAAGRPMSSYKSGWLSACRGAGYDHDIYTLRDTMITNSLKRGLSSSFIAKYVDNSAAMIDRHYAVAEREAMMGVAG